MKTRSPIIAMTGGGSGGHITPILSLAHELKRLEPNCEIIYIGHKGDNFDSFHASSHDFDFLAFINGGKFRRYHGESFWSHLIDFKTVGLNIRDFFRVINSIGTSLRILNRSKPDVLFSKGGFVAVPVGIAARLKQIPIVTHDSDAIGGLANRIVGRWAAVRTSGVPVIDNKARYVGIPLAARIKPVNQVEQKKLKRRLGVGEASFVLLVAGGGLGSKSINDKLVNLSPALLKQNPALRIIHVTGENNLGQAKHDYSNKLDESARGRVRLIGFIDDFYKLVGAADLIISRAGATSLAEYAMAEKACIVIPSPFLAGGHQLKNADILRQNDAAIIVNEDAPEKELLSTIEELMGSPHRRRQIASNLRKLAQPNAAHDLAKIILEAARPKL